ncbi:MAG: 30S ribosomal protein S1 [Anaerolineae bacterium]
MVVGVNSLQSLSHFLEEAERRYNQCQDSSAVGADLDHVSGHTLEFIPEEAGEPLVTDEAYQKLDECWQAASQVFGDGDVVRAIVTGWNRGGLLVRWNDLQGFVPASQLKDVMLFEEDEGRDERIARWIGEVLRLKVIELDRSRNRLVFSERATAWGPKDGEHLLQEIEAGDVRRGYVSNLCDFGAFVDLGGVDGLIHLSELSWRRITHPRELLSIGHEVEVFVISVDKANRRIALSLKRLRPDPWTTVDTKYQVGQVVPATITNIVDFGAFAQIEDGLEGLVHVTEMCESKIGHPAELVSSHDSVRVRILRIDSANHRLGLSMRLEEKPGSPEEWSSGTSFLY